MSTLLQDIRYGLRMLGKAPGFTLVAVLTLALGIGANTAIFTVINAVLLRPLPYRDPGRLVVVGHPDDAVTKGSFIAVNVFGVSQPNYADFRDQNHSFEQLAVYTPASFILTGGKQPVRIEATLVSANLLPMLDVAPLAGRWFVAGEDEPGRDQLVIISYGLWQREFGGRREALGKSLTLDGKTYTVIGVMPPAFVFPAQSPETELWLPLAFPAEARVRGAHFLDVLGRLKPDVPLAEAQADLENIRRGLSRQYPKEVPGKVSAVPLKTLLVGDVRSSLLMLGGAVALVLLIAVANVAGLLLARAGSRQKEVAIRAAMGATRGRVVRQFLTESILLALLGGVAGLLLASWSTDLLMAISPADLPRAHHVAIDRWVVLFGAGASVLTGIAFGLASSLHAGAPNLNEALKEGRSATVSRQRARRVLVCGEVVLAFVLLCAAGLMVRTLMKLTAVDPGFDPENVLTAEILLPDSYSKPAQRAAFFDQLLSRLEALPGVSAVGATSTLPLGGTRMTFHAELPSEPGQQIKVGFRAVSPGYFRSMRIPVRQGRFFAPNDTAGAKFVGVINERLARRFWPGENPIGKTIKSGFIPGLIEIVGMAGDVKSAALDEASEPELYVPLAQRPWPFLRLVLRGKSDPLQLVPALRAQVSSLDKELPVDKVRTMKSVMAATFARRRFYMLLLGGFAALALGLAAVGIYGVVSYEVEQRTHEIGIRMALGARRESILRMVVVQGMRPTLAGLAIGVMMALGVTRVLRSLLFAVSPDDPLTFLVVVLVLTIFSLLAALGPARRATKVDPMVALRYE